MRDGYIKVEHVAQKMHENGANRIEKGGGRVGSGKTRCLTRKPLREDPQ
jgi:hypothetical protein